MVQAQYISRPLQFFRPAGTSRGVLKQKACWYILLTNDQGQRGIGEVSVIPGLSVEDPGELDIQLDHICKLINRGEMSPGQELPSLPGVQFALETALLDLQNGGRRLLYPSDFTRGIKGIPTNGLIWMGTRDFMMEQLTEKLEAGFHVLKMKVGALDFEEEVAVLRRIRKDFNKVDLEIRLDANGAWSPEEAREKMEKLASFGIHSVEQPIAAGQIAAMAELCLTAAIPVALDEELIGISDQVKRAALLEEIRPAYIILKPGLLGGFSAAESWIALATKLNIGWWATSALESNIGLNAIAQWTASQEVNVPQGLGTGSLFSNNINSPLEMEGDSLWYRPGKEWDLQAFNKMGPFIIEGKSFSKKALMAHCHMMVHDCKNPDWYRKVFQFVEAFLDPASGPLIQRSSGTTGDPKTFDLNREAMRASAHKTLAFFGLKQGMRVLLALSVDYIAGKMMVVRALEGGLDLVLTEPSSRPLEHAQGDFAFVPMVPMQVYKSLKAGDQLSRCGTLLIGGGELSLSLKEELRSLPVLEVYESFGMSETYTHFALRRIKGPEADISFRVLEGSTISTDERGCLVINLPGVTEGPVVSNDLVEIGSDGNSFKWLGRYDNVINTGGIKVIPEILEAQIGSLLGATALILPLEDEKLGQKMVLLVEWVQALKEDFPSDIVNSWKKILGSALTSFELPKDIIAVPELPRNAARKLDRKAAKNLLHEL